jgi:acetyl-CoA decarbonylase/synthase complex subunit delta
MPVEILKEKFTGKVQEVVLGATKEEGGTRARTVKLGGSSTLPFLQYEGEIPNPPAIAFEVWDIKPDWHECFEPYYGDVWNDPVAWAKKAEELGADVIYLEFKGGWESHSRKSFSRWTGCRRCRKHCASRPQTTLSGWPCNSCLDHRPI